jgi:hypothetical protein
VPGDAEPGEMRADDGQVDVGARAGHHEGAHLLAQERIRGRADGRFGDVGMQDQKVLDLTGGDVLPAPDDDVLLAVGDDQVPVGVEAADIAGPEPAAGQEGLGVEGGVAVAGELPRPPGDDLPFSAGRDVGAFVVDQADLIAVGDTPVGTVPFLLRIFRGARAEHGMLGRSVGPPGNDPQALSAVHQARRNARRPGEEAGEAADVTPGATRFVEQGRQEERSPRACLQPVLLDQLRRLGGAPPIHDHRDAALEQRRDRPQQARDVAGGKRGQNPPRDGRPAAGRGEHAVVRVLDALGLAGRSRGVDEQADLIGIAVRKRRQRCGRDQVRPPHRRGRRLVVERDDRGEFREVVRQAARLSREIGGPPPVRHAQGPCPALSEDELQVTRSERGHHRKDHPAAHPDRDHRRQAPGRCGRLDGDDVPGADATINQVLCDPAGVSNDLRAGQVHPAIGGGEDDRPLRRVLVAERGGQVGLTEPALRVPALAQGRAVLDWVSAMHHGE